MSTSSEPIDVLMLQLGTPQAPTAKALRVYLRQFLMDPRVIELPYWFRWMLINLIIVPFRAPASAEKYKRIWDDKTGSPLLSITKKQQEKLQATLGDRFRVSFAMRYGEPSVKSYLERNKKNKIHRMIVLPMYPQYSATTTGSALDDLFHQMRSLRDLPKIRCIRNYGLDEGYLQACTNAMKNWMQQNNVSDQDVDRYIISFHGIPIDYIKRGDPYMKESAQTGKTIAKMMGWDRSRWNLVFQSRLGRQKWLLPYFDETIIDLAKSGTKRVLVFQPGFTTDCLETIDEIGYEGHEDFTSNGGEELYRVPCLNDTDDFINSLKEIVLKEASDWV